MELLKIVSELHANPEPSELKGNKENVSSKVQRLRGEDNQPISPTRAPDTLTEEAEGDDIVRYSRETRRVVIKKTTEQLEKHYDACIVGSIANTDYEG